MKQSVNPYQPPGSEVAAESSLASDASILDIDWAAFPNERIDFAFHLDRRDVRKLFQTPRVGCLLLALVVVLISLWLLSLPTAASVPGPTPPGQVGTRGQLTLGATVDVAGLLMTTVALSAVALVGWRISRLWRRAIKQTPGLLEPTSGYLFSKGVYLERNESRGVSYWPMLTRVGIDNRGVQLQAEHWRLVSVIVPWDAFENPVAAKEVLSRVRNSGTIRPVSLGDARLKEPIVEELHFPPPPGSVSFDGEITYGEMVGTTPGRRMKRTLYRWLLGGLVVLALGMMAFFPARLAAVMLGLPLIVVGGLVTYRAGRYLLQLRREHEVVLCVQGWISPTTCCVQSASGQTALQWRAFADCAVERDVICVRIRGSVDAWQFFPQRLFASKDDYDRAVEWARSAGS